MKKLNISKNNNAIITTIKKIPKELLTIPDEYKDATNKLAKLLKSKKKLSSTKKNRSWKKDKNRNKEFKTFTDKS